MIFWLTWSWNKFVSEMKQFGHRASFSQFVRFFNKLDHNLITENEFHHSGDISSQDHSISVFKWYIERTSSSFRQSLLMNSFLAKNLSKWWTICWSYFQLWSKIISATENDILVLICSASTMFCIYKMTTILNDLVNDDGCCRSSMQGQCLASSGRCGHHMAATWSFVCVYIILYIYVNI